MAPRFPWVAIAIAVTVCVDAPFARADAPLTSFSWAALPGAESCGGAPEIAAAIEQRLGRAVLVSPTQSDRSIEAYVERSGRPPLWHASVVVRDRGGAVLGRREFNSSASDCSELRSSVVLAVALMIDPEAVLHPPAVAAAPPEPPPAPTSSTPPPPPEPPPPPPEPVASVPERPPPPPPAPVPWGATSSASFAMGFGVLPSMAVGVEVGVVVSPPHFWDLAVFGGAWGPQTLPAAGGAQVRFTLPWIGLAACPLRIGRPGRVSLSLCAGPEVSLLLADAENFVSSGSSVHPMVGVVAPVHLRFPIARGFALGVGGNLGVYVWRDQYVYEAPAHTPHPIYSYSPVWASADVGVSLALP